LPGRSVVNYRRPIQASDDFSRFRALGDG